jgi:heme exporter protein C
VLAAAVAAVLALVVAPPERYQGQAQRLMYLHVPAAWTAFLAFAVVCVASVAVLLRGGPRWDARARAAAELGVGMTALAIAEGSVWGHSAWGVWWTWDPRLVSTALMLLVYTAYLSVRALPAAPEQAARRAAVLGVVGFAVVPAVHFSVLWWRTVHQPPTLLRPELDAPIAAPMLAALLASVVAYTLAGAWYVRRRASQLAPTTPAAPVVPVAAAAPQTEAVSDRVVAGQGS